MDTFKKSRYVYKNIISFKRDMDKKSLTILTSQYRRQIRNTAGHQDGLRAVVMVARAVSIIIAIRQAVVG